MWRVWGGVVRWVRTVSLSVLLEGRLRGESVVSVECWNATRDEHRCRCASSGPCEAGGSIPSLSMPVSACCCEAVHEPRGAIRHSGHFVLGSCWATRAVGTGLSAPHRSTLRLPTPPPVSCCAQQMLLPTCGIAPFTAGCIQHKVQHAATSHARLVSSTWSMSSSSSLLYANQQTSDGDSRAVTELSSQSVCSSPPSPMTRTVTTTTSS